MTERVQQDAGASGHMSVEDFRKYGREVIDWIADYWESVDERPVLAQVQPGQIKAQLPATAPESPESFGAVMSDLDTLVMPGITHWQHPRFFAYFPANSSPASVLADLVSSGLGVQGMIWSTSPAVTEIEQVVMDWLAQALDLPADFRNDGAGGGVIQDTASTATFTALLCALQRASAGAVRQSGLGAHKYAVYCSTQAHSSMLKAAMMAGLGEQQVRLIEVDPKTQAMVPSALRAAIDADVEAGVVPCMVLAAVGTTSTCAFDSVIEIGQITKDSGIWLHVDAAFAGVAAVCPEFRWINDGVAAYADSYVTNPHKWLLTTFDCSAFWVRDREVLLGALSILPEYLRNAASESGAVVDYRDWHPQLGRRFRSLKLWTVMRSYGISGLQQHIRSGVALAQQFAALVDADHRFEILTPHTMSVVVFRLVGRDDADTMNLMETVNASGEAYLTHTKVNGVAALRLAVGALHTTPADIDRTWAALTREVPATSDTVHP